MKIAILTLPLNTNYGGILQAYALQTVLKRMGHEVEILQKSPSKAPITWKTPLGFIKRLTIKLLRNRQQPLFPHTKNLNEKLIIEQNTSKFISRYLDIRLIQSLYDVQEDDYDGIIVGSDQVWRKKYFTGNWFSLISDAFLHFTTNWNITRIAYAASFGTDTLENYSKNDIDTCKKLLSIFNAISVRENGGIEICKNYFGVNASHVLDPTLLLDKEDYIQLIKASQTPPSQGDLLCYILDPSNFKKQVISEIATKSKLKPFNTSVEVGNYNLSIEQRIQPSVESWLRGFWDAKFIVTDSFHACVFSIIFGKPFVAIGNQERGLDRFLSLLKMFNLENRLIKENCSYNLNKDLFNFDKSDLQIFRIFSQNFLEKNL